MTGDEQEQGDDYKIGKKVKTPQRNRPELIHYQGQNIRTAGTAAPHYNKSQADGFQQTADNWHKHLLPY